MLMSHLRLALPVALGVATALTLSGCGSGKQSQAPGGPPEVGIFVLQSQRLPLSTQLPGRTVAYRIAQVRPQVSGIIKQRLYTEGAEVSAGQPLYQLDPATYQAAYDSAQAAQAKADANALTVRLKFQRYQKLATTGDVSQQERDDVTANLSQAEADQATAHAAVETARINLGYTRIVAPIAGRIGTSAFTEGALVTANQESPLTTVQQYNPMYVDLTQPAAEVLRFRQQLAAGSIKGITGRTAGVRLLLDDGSSYPTEGRLEFTGITVSESTGAITLRAIFPNPDGRLLPGMYVRAVLAQGVDEQALLVPQQAVTRNARGEAIALVVGADDKVVQRTLEIRSADGDQWRVGSGLQAGDRVIVQGVQNARVGSAVKPVGVDVSAPAAPAMPAAPAVPAVPAAR
jgi:membrane fusion protein (multidrug efflux system)